MSKEVDTNHPEFDELADYVADNLDDASAATIEEHIAYCDSCALISSQINRVSTLWDNWPDRVEQESSLAIHVAARVRESIASLTGKLGEGLAEALQEFGGVLGAAVLSFENSVRTSVVTEGLASLLASTSPVPNLQPLPVGFRPRGGGGRAGAASSNLTHLVAGGRPGSPEVTVEIDVSRRKIAIKFRNWPEGGSLPQPMLIPLEGGPPLIPDAEQWDLELRRVTLIVPEFRSERIDYILAFAPMPPFNEAR